MVQLRSLAVSTALVFSTSVYGAPTAGSNGLPFDEAILQAALAHPESFGFPEAVEPEMSLFAASTNYTTYEPSEVSGGDSEVLSKVKIETSYSEEGHVKRHTVHRPFGFLESTRRHGSSDDEETVNVRPGEGYEVIELVSIEYDSSYHCEQAEEKRVGRARVA